MAFNYALPFLVASIGYLGAHRTRRDDHAHAAPELGD
jgi:hypothetical protein